MAQRQNDNQQIPQAAFYGPSIVLVRSNANEGP
jgi:hypothetical protein